MMNFEAGRRFERGQREKFAISALFDEAFENYYYIGRFTFFVDSKQFGDWEDFTNLATGARWARTCLKRRERECIDVSDMESHYLFWRIYGSHFSPSMPHGYHSLIEDPHWYDSEPFAWSPNKFSLDIIGESSTRDSAVVLAIPQPDRTDRILAYEYDTEEIGDATIRSEEVVQIVSEFAEWVEGLGELEGQ